MAFTLIDGLVTGTMYGLFALGIVLVYRGTRVINFAAPAIGSLGLYVTHFLHVERGTTWVTAAMVGLLAAGATMLAFERFVVRRMRDAEPLAIAVATIGLMLLIISGELVLFGASPRRLPDPVEGAAFILTGVPMTWTKLLSIAVAVTLAVALTQFLKRTDFGLGVQAAAMDAQAVQLVGVRLNQINAFVWAVGGMSAVVAALLVLPTIGGFQPGTVTALFFLPAVAGALVGGLDNLTGAFVGGVVIGMLTQFADRLLLTTNFPGASELAVFLAILLTLLLAPRGVIARLRPILAGEA